MSTDTLDQLTDSALSEAFAVEVAGCVKTEHPDDWTDTSVRQVWFDASKSRTLISIPYSLRSAPGKFAHSWTMATFATSFDAVSPYLHPYVFTVGRLLRAKGDGIDYYAPMTYVVTIYHGATSGNGVAGKGEAETLARAACIALIRATRAKKGGAK